MAAIMALAMTVPLAQVVRGLECHALLDVSLYVVMNGDW